MEQMREAAWELQKAVFKRLNEDSQLMSLVTAVYDFVPEEAEFPYVSIGEQTDVPFNTKFTVGENRTLVLHGWSDYPGKKQGYEINNLMLQALTKSPIQLEGGFSLQDFRKEPGSTVFQDIDGRTYHSVLRVRFYINN